MLRQKLIDNWQWTCLCLVLIYCSIFTRPPIPIDETRYLSVAWEMWQSHNFLVPHINGHPYSQKPPLFFWLINLSWLLFGVGEWPARLVGPLFGFGSIALTVRLAKQLWPGNRAVRLAVPFILLGTLVWSIYSTLTMFDTLLTFIALLALLSILSARNGNTLLSWICFSCTIGLGILAKGPVILLYVLPPALLAPLWATSKPTTWKRWYGSVFAALLAGIAIALCWAIPAALAGGEEYRQAILYRQTAGRMVNAFAHGRPFYWYLPLLPLLTLPWFFWLPAWRGWKIKTFDRSTAFCLSVVLPTFFLLSCVSGKQLHYILPLLPLISLLIAKAVTTVPKRTRFDRIPLLVILLALSIALFVIPLQPPHGGDREMLQYLPKWIGFVPLLIGLLLYFVHADSIIGSIKTVTSSMLLLVILLHFALASPLHRIYDQTVIGKAIRTVQEKNSQVAVYPAKLTDQFQFAGKLTVPLIGQKTLDDLTAWSKANPQGYCLIFTKDNSYQQPQGDPVTASQYKDGRLILLPAADFAASPPH